MNTDKLVKCVSKYFTLKAYNKKYNDYMAYIGDQVVGFFAILGKDANPTDDALSMIRVLGKYCVSFEGNFIPLDSKDKYVTLWSGLDKDELEQSVKNLYMNCLLNCSSNSFLR